MAERSFGPVVVRRRLGSELRRLRIEAGMSLERAARGLEVSPSKLSRLENGESPPKLWDVRNLLTLYGVEDAEYRHRAERWVNEGRAQGWWHPYSDASPGDLDHFVSLEAEAAEVRVYSAPFLYGLLQTEAYARALLHGLLPDLSAEKIDGLVRVRMQRQQRLDEPHPLRVKVIVDESTLRRSVGEPDVMRFQWEHLITLAERLDLRVRTLEATPHLALHNPFTIFVPREEVVDPTVVNLESAFHDSYWEDPTAVGLFVSSFETLYDTALDRGGSTDFIRQLIARDAGRS